ncbi:MAG: HDOD domain-containing protein [Pseudomonadales bacterium]|nr:HDOD domain-containing protein [Pseudomonadales bacterium]
MPDKIQVNELDAETALKGIVIPPHPMILQDIAKVYPDIDQVAKIIVKDPAVSGAVIKVINSATFQLARTIESVKDAVALLGMDSVLNIINALLLKVSFYDLVDMDELSAFWRVSDDNAVASAFIARELKLCKPDLAYMAGLFHDCGIPLMMQKNKGYLVNLKRIYGQNQHPFLAVENRLYHTDHCALGYYMGRSWKLPEEVISVIQDHHNLERFSAENLQQHSVVNSLLVIEKMAEHITREYAELGKAQANHEWEKIKETIFDYTGLCEMDFQDLLEKTTEAIQEAVA